MWLTTRRGALRSTRNKPLIRRPTALVSRFLHRASADARFGFGGGPNTPGRGEDGGGRAPARRRLMGLAPTRKTEAGRLLAHSRSATLAARRENEEWSVAMMNTATNVNTATNGLWPLAGVVRRR